jgi:hypothetical protein
MLRQSRFQRTTIAVHDDGGGFSREGRGGYAGGRRREGQREGRREKGGKRLLQR